MTGSPLVTRERRDRYAVVTLNRPDKMNAVNLALADALVATLASLEDCPVIVLTGAGRAFCAGVDLAERPTHRRDWRSAFGVSRSQYWAEVIETMRRHPAVFIAAVNGYALGGGLTLVNNSELAVASDKAQFGMPELGFGSFPAVAGPSTARRVLAKHVAEMVFVPGRVDAAKALSFGLVNEVVPAAELLPRACRLADEVAARDPVALAYAKRGIRDLELMGWADGIEYGAHLSAAVTAIRTVSAASDADGPAAGGPDLAADAGIRPEPGGGEYVE